jgi:hypothetical protein
MHDTRTPPCTDEEDQGPYLVALLVCCLISGVLGYLLGVLVGPAW